MGPSESSESCSHAADFWHLICSQVSSWVVASLAVPCCITWRSVVWSAYSLRRWVFDYIDGGNSSIFYFHVGKCSNLTSIFFKKVETTNQLSLSCSFSFPTDIMLGFKQPIWFLSYETCGITQICQFRKQLGFESVRSLVLPLHPVFGMYLLNQGELTCGATWHAAGLVTRFHGGNNFRLWHDEVDMVKPGKPGWLDRWTSFNCALWTATPPGCQPLHPVAIRRQERKEMTDFAVLPVLWLGSFFFLQQSFVFSCLNSWLLGTPLSFHTPGSIRLIPNEPGSYRAISEKIHETRWQTTTEGLLGLS